MTVASQSCPSIVIAGSFSYVSTTMGLANGFEAMGWKVYPIDPGSFSIKSDSLVARVYKRLCKHVSRRQYNQAIRDCVLSVKPTVFLTVKGSNISRETLELIRSAGTTTINYYPDSHFKHPGLDEALFSLYDRFYTTKSYQVDYLNRLLGSDRVELLHHGYLPPFHKPPVTVPGEKYTADIVYIGNHSLEKERWLAAIKQRVPTARMKIHGNRWAHCASKNILGPSICNGPVYGSDYAAAIHSSKINLGIHMGILDQTGWYDLVSTRTFEIPASKGFMLHVDNDEVRQLFSPGIEIDLFKDLDELCEKIEFYLSHDELRHEMLERAYQRCVPAYSYDERARVIADSLFSIPAVG